LSNPEPSSGSHPRHVVPAVLGIGVSVALLWWALRGVHLSDILQHVTTARPVPLAAAIVVATATFPLRLIRWRLLLRREDGSAYPVAPLWHAVAVGFMANNILPLRAGEVVRSYAASRLAGIRFSTVVSSIVVERIFDGLTVVFLLSLALLSPDLPPSVSVAGVSVRKVATTGGLIGAAGLLAAVLVLAAPLAADWLVRRVVPWTRLADRLVSLIEGIRRGLVVLRDPGRLLGVLIWSLVLWGVNALGFYLGFLAFNIPVAYTGALLLQGLLVLGVSIPSTPGFFGPFEAVIVAVLALYGIPRDLAFSYALAFHLTTFVPITLLGFWSLTRIPGGFRLLRQATP